MVAHEKLGPDHRCRPTTTTSCAELPEDILVGALSVVEHSRDYLQPDVYLCFISSLGIFPVPIHRPDGQLVSFGRDR